MVVSFKKNNIINIGYTLYFDEDYYRGYQSILKEKGRVLLGDMKELLKRIMGFPPLDEELIIFYDFSGKRSLEEELSWDELLNTLNKVRTLLNERAKKAKNYTSYGKYSFDYYHHRTAASDPNIVFRSPATKGMNYGFYDFDNMDNSTVNNVHKPIVKCPETKFAESMIKLKYVPIKQNI